jgi:hypothetical protein
VTFVGFHMFCASKGCGCHGSAVVSEDFHLHGRAAPEFPSKCLKDGKLKAVLVGADHPNLDHLVNNGIMDLGSVLRGGTLRA